MAGDVFEAERLPSYAKTYILPRQMRRASSGAEEEKKHGFVKRKQSLVTPAFQMSMLRASLEEKGAFSATIDGSEMKPLIDKPPKSESQLTNYRDTSRIRRKALETIL